ncbi:hypothetical protein IGI04_040580, partial [Brassica rapa subsp. trilocularis]
RPVQTLQCVVSVGEISAINRPGSVHRLWRLGTIGFFFRVAIRVSCSSSSIISNLLRASSISREGICKVIHFRGYSRNVYHVKEKIM